jgi:hypothetical protein
VSILERFAPDLGLQGQNPALGVLQARHIVV